ncbi:SAM-dependent methyltransferase [Nocardia sp. NBC_01730]|uniref:SAM-dependent methyltransferase n=1 Tax=Nocardia sp. NBC_01730 TaxID=2975998 RepID=UPI002E13FF0B|nr:SAM-dependent methyltransferase [Nocardia sp. NBC_01730]
MGTSQGPVGSVSLSGIGETSLGVAALRARESARPDRLFEDPYAQRFLDAAGYSSAAWAARPSSGRGFLDLMSDQVAVRTRFFDEVLLDAAGDGCSQVVLLASGMDARPYRLGWPSGTRLFEVDFGEVLAFKRRALAGVRAVPQCAHFEVAADLSKDWPEVLRGAGFRADAPTIWLAEGILYALPGEAADLLLERMTELSAPGSELAADHAEDSEVLREARAAISEDLVRLWGGGPTTDLDAWLEGHGWEPGAHEFGTIARSFKRPVPPAFNPQSEGSGRGWLITARLRVEKS